MSKVLLATQMIEERIAFADHVVTGIPSERQLAEELGLSRFTVRKAVEGLVEKGTLSRQENGRLGVAPQSGAGRAKTIGFIAPVGPSANRDEWRESLRGVVDSLDLGPGVVVRTVTYGHWADPVLQEALAAFDGAFFMAISENIPNWLRSKIHESRCRLMALDSDQSRAGLPSVLLFSPAAEPKLFDHLYRLGHRRIDCINTQYEDAVIKDRIAAWRVYQEARGIGGQLLSLTHDRPIELAYRLVRDFLYQGRDLAPALFCTTGPAAMGAMRAVHEAGLKIGHDISVCAVNSEGVGRYLMPSLTALEAPPRGLYLRRALEWMLGHGEWQGPLVIQPEDVPLFEGESTGPCPAHALTIPAPLRESEGNGAGRTANGQVGGIMV